MKVWLCNATPHEEQLIRSAADVGLDTVPIVAGLIEAIQRMDGEISKLSSANEKLSEKLESTESKLREERDKMENTKSKMGGAR